MDSNAHSLAIIATSKRLLIGAIGMILIAQSTGCFVPFSSPAIPAASLPDEFRTPIRSSAKRINLASLSLTPPQDFILDRGDTVNVLVPGMFNAGQTATPFVARIMADGTITLPNLGRIHIAGLNLSAAQQRIDRAYIAGKKLVDPRVTVSLASPATIDVTVLGSVARPGVYSLPRYRNDVANALGRAGGLTDLAAEVIEVHRQARPATTAKPKTVAFEQTRSILAGTGQQLTRLPRLDNTYERHLKKVMFGNVDDGQFSNGLAKSAGGTVLTIPLRGGGPSIEDGSQTHAKPSLELKDVVLQSGDVIVVPKQSDEVFFVVGPLSETRSVQFSVTDRSRSLGNAFILPKDRDVDVVTAVAMAGYIDPLSSPTTVTVHRSRMGQCPVLIRVDLIRARYDWQENLYVQAGDIIYLNPDSAWWWRRTFNQIAPDLLRIPYRSAMGRWINPMGIQ